MVTVVKQSRFALWRYEEIYEFPVPAGCPCPAGQILNFYQRQRLEDCFSDATSVRFIRGSVFASVFGPSERRQRQRASFQIVGQTVVCRFNCYVPIHVQIPPSQLHKEVEQLEKFLQEQVGGIRALLPQRRRFWNFVFKPLYWSYRASSGLVYWGKRRFTPAGITLVVTLVIVTIFSVDIESMVIYQAFALLTSVALFAFLFSFFFRAKFSTTRLLPRLGTAGQPLRYKILVRNLTTQKQESLVLLENLVDPRPTFDEWLAFHRAEDRRFQAFRISSRKQRNPFRLANLKEAAVPPLMPKSEVEVAAEIFPVRRGILLLTGVTIARPDPFGLFRSFIPVPAAQTVLILPKRYALPPIALPGAMRYQEGGVAMAAHVGSSEEFVAMRDYRHGDPLRHIHWRSWAKVGKPIVKEFEDEFFVRHALVLDTFDEEPNSEVLEEAVSVAASFACTILTQESLLDLLFVGNQSYCFTAGRGLAHADQMLEILASVKHCPDKPFSELETLVLNHIGSVSGCICVLQRWDETRRNFIEKLKALNLPLLVLVVVPPGGGISGAGGVFAGAEGALHVLQVGKIQEGLNKLQ